MWPITKPTSTMPVIAITTSCRSSCPEGYQAVADNHASRRRDAAKESDCRIQILWVLHTYLIPFQCCPHPRPLPQSGRGKNHIWFRWIPNSLAHSSACPELCRRGRGLGRGQFSFCNLNAGKRASTAWRSLADEVLPRLSREPARPFALPDQPQSRSELPPSECRLKRVGGMRKRRGERGSFRPSTRAAARIIASVTRRAPEATTPSPIAGKM